MKVNKRTLTNIYIDFIMRHRYLSMSCLDKRTVKIVSVKRLIGKGL